MEIEKSLAQVKVDDANASMNYLDVRILVRALLRWSWLVVLVGAFGAYQGLEKVRHSTPSYKASMVVQPDAGSGDNNAASELGQVLGISLSGGGTATSFGRLQVVIGSVGLARDLQEQHRLMQTVFAGSWDEENAVWLTPAGEKVERQQRIRRYLGLSEWSPPDEEDLASFLAGGIQFKNLKTPGFFEVSFQHTDQDLALYVLRTVYYAADARTRPCRIPETASVHQPTTRFRPAG